MAVTQILVVDDSLPWQRFMQNLLGSQADLKIVGTAINGVQAIEKAQELQPDVVLMDLCLPGKNGFEATTEIRTLCASSRILFLTEHHDSEFVEAAFRAGASGYVLKSDSFSDLLTGIRLILRGEPFVSHSLKSRSNGGQ